MLALGSWQRGPHCWYLYGHAFTMYTDYSQLMLLCSLLDQTPDGIVGST